MKVIFQHTESVENWISSSKHHLASLLLQSSEAVCGKFELIKLNLSTETTMVVIVISELQGRFWI